MLVLTRRIDESLVIGDNIVITILGIEGERVKIGITAPREVQVLRQELWQAIREQEQIAQRLAQASPENFKALRQFLAEEVNEDQAQIEAGDEGLNEA